MTPEPAQSATAKGLTAVLVILFGPELGNTLAPWLADGLIVALSALIGAYHSVGTAPTATRWHGVQHIFKWTCTALVLSFALAQAFESVTSIPATRWPGIVAFIVAFCAEKWKIWIPAVITARLGIRKHQE